MSEFHGLIINDLGVIYSELGEFQKALEYKMQTLEIQQKIFGEHHPYMAVSVDNIGANKEIRIFS
jgi:tetratricopeptide (TPR) repeat protein